MAAPPLEDLVRQSRFIFRGTVESLNEATLPAVPVNSYTAIVRVNEVVQAPESLRDLTNQRITVQLQETPPAQVGQQALFFTNPWLYGTEIAVQEVGRQEIEEGASAAARSRVRREVTSMVQSLPDEALKSRLAAAELVIAGRVIDTKPVGTARIRPATEHDPQWWEAVIAVEDVLKGSVPPPDGAAGQAGVAAQPLVRALFANSMDVTWFQAPKLRPGQEGIWLLHREEPLKPAFAAYGVLDPLDAHPKDQLTRLRRLLP
jgi:hypothetical protein